jgi:hypothetical protein
MTKAKKVALSSVEEFEKMFFPRAYQEKILSLEEDTEQALGIAADWLGEVQRRLPKKRQGSIRNSV